MAASPECGEATTFSVLIFTEAEQLSSFFLKKSYLARLLNCNMRIEKCLNTVRRTKQECLKQRCRRMGENEEQDASR
jgi:hypothetical protein